MAEAEAIAPGGDTPRSLALGGRTPPLSMTATWVTGLSAAVLLGALTALMGGPVALPGSAGPVAAPSHGVGQFLRANEEPRECRDWYSVGNDCSKPNHWGCLKNDWSIGYKCCCQYGWGDFSNNSNHQTGMINWASHPEKCIDLTMPYVGSGVPFKTSHTIISGCTWGNPNKQFHLPVTGQGKIHWATHPDFCLGVRNGGGSEVGLDDCVGNDGWKRWDMSGEGLGKPHQIRWATNPSMCLDVQGGMTKDWTTVQLTNCQAGAPSQLFNVSVPQPPPAWADVPKLFCISLMMPTGYEAGMLKAQHAKGVGIFECNEYAVYSNESITLTHGKGAVKTDVMKGSLAVKFGGQWHSALNTDVFIRFWAKVVSDKRAWRNEWTVKIDPDAVFFPGRLREMLRNKWDSGNPEKAVYLNNCHRGMHGPIEVLSQQALKVYKKEWKKCKEGPPYEHKQEDFYFRRCWAYLDIQKV